MKRNNLIFSILITYIMLISCSKDYLTLNPLDRITDVSMDFSAQQCKLYVNKYYTSLVSSYIYYADHGTDNLLSISYNDNVDLITNLRTVPSSGGGWSTSEWGNIRSINFLLDNYKKSKELSAAEVYVGEAKFFRAFYYYEQFLKRFGGVPWIGKGLTLTSAELYSPRLDRNILADSILADLDWAIQKIPSKATQDQGRVSKEVALLYQARIALFEGTWEKYHASTPFAGQGDFNSYLRKARDAALAVMNSGLFNLDNINKNDGYNILFDQFDYSTSKEVMLWKKFDRSLGLWNSDNRNPGRNGGSYGVTRRLVDSYLCIDIDGTAKPISLASNYQGDANNLTVIANRDPRLRQTIFTPGRPRTVDNNGRDTTIIFTKPNINLTDAEKCATGYELAKGADYHAEEQVTVTGSIKATIYFRYAEALLIYAEARAELGEITQNDLDISVNKLRDRVGMPHLSLAVGYTDPNGEFTAARGYTGVPVSNLLQEIRRERRVELACEGYRNDDLRRWRAHHLWNSDKIQGAKTAQFTNLSWLVTFFSTFHVPAAITGGYSTFINTTVPKWSPAIKEGTNFWTDSEGYFAPYQKFLPDGHFQFDPNKSYLLPIATQELLLNTTLVQNPGW